jgi:UDP-GlcNAc:undecaprenyl-phosphate GlcNAc-1-phosphate transferase
MSPGFETLLHHVPFGLASLGITLVLTPIAAAAARRFDVMDHPDQVLKPHARPTPYLGGLAIALGWTAGIALALFLPSDPNTHKSAGALLPIVAGGLAMSALGLRDDAGDLPPKLRLLISAAVVAGVILVPGVGLRLLDSVTEPPRYGLGGLVAYGVAIAAGVFIVLGACNSTNLIDGLDGLCAGVTGVMGVSYAVLAALAMTSALPQAGSLPVAEHASSIMLIALPLSGAVLGFLPFNFNPARIFMGDAGSLLLGYTCGMLILMLSEFAELRWVLGGIIIFGLPIFDTALALFRRWRSRKPIFQGDRSHFYDQLVQRGFSIRQTALICYAVAALYGAAGLAVTWLSAVGAIVFFFATVIATAGLAWAAGLTNPERRLERGDASHAGIP